jgi:exopolysaccharide biosynthesis predicted pyruvyltransferase EpsI
MKILNFGRLFFYHNFAQELKLRFYSSCKIVVLPSNLSFSPNVAKAMLRKKAFIREQSTDFSPEPKTQDECDKFK